MDGDLTFDFERTLEAQQPPSADVGSDQAQIGPGGRAEAKPRNYRQTVCTYWLRGLCMKGDTCGFLHEFNADRMPVCRNLLKFGVCKEADCPYKHTTTDIKECNMYKLGFCIYGPACRFKHTRSTGPPPDPELLEAAKPRDFRNIAIVANQANDGILPADIRRRPLRLTQGGSQEQFLSLPASQGGGMAPGAGHMVVAGHQGGQGQGHGGRAQGGQGGGSLQPPAFVDQSLLASVGQRDLRYGF